MNASKKMLLLAAAGLLCATGARAESSARLVITHTPQKGSGLVYLAIFSSSNGFPENPGVALQALQIPLQDGVGQTVVRLPKGTYAISAFYDADANGRLTKNIFGAPAEPYAFSNNARPTFRAPSFKEAAFRIDADKVAITLDLR